MEAVKPPPFPLPPVLARLFELLEGYTEGREAGFFMAEQDRNRQHRAQPVLVYVGPEALRGEGRTGEPRPPDWLGEVREGEDEGDRAVRAARAGVREYWRVDPAGPAVWVHTEPRPDGGWGRREVFRGDEPVRSDTFPGLVLRPSDLL